MAAEGGRIDYMFLSLSAFAGRWIRYCTVTDAAAPCGYNLRVFGLLLQGKKECAVTVTGAVSVGSKAAEENSI